MSPYFLVGEIEEGSEWVLRSQHIGLIPERVATRLCRVDINHYSGMLMVEYNDGTDGLFLLSEFIQLFQPQDEK